MLGLRDEFLYFECSNCKCLQIAEFPDNISKYYPSDYYSFRKNKKDGLKRYSDFLFKYRIKMSVLPHPGLLGPFLNALLPLKNVTFLKGTVKDTNVRILDVGCGNGQKFLIPLYRAGFKNVAGCDPFLENEIDSHNPVIFKKEIFDMEGEWDIITFNHSFEHLENPLETLQKAKSLLKPGGYCIIRIPTASSYAWQHYGINWFQLDAPRHYFLHSVESIGYLVEKTSFNLEKIDFDSTHHQFTISQRYKKGKTMKERSYSPGLGRLVNVIQKIINASKAHKLNRQQRGDQAIFYLKK